MNYSAGAVVLATSGTSLALPGNGVAWVAARLALDGAGALFGLYLVAGIGLSLAGWLMRCGRAGATGSAE
jgi:hypothetical protein